MDNQRIEGFVQFFQANIALVEQLDLSQKGSADLYQKILYAGLFDSLTKPLGFSEKNRVRYTAALQTSAGWKESTRVSAPHLAKALETNVDDQFVSLRRFLDSTLATWPPEKFIELGLDPTLEEVKSLWPQHTPLKIPGLGIQLEYFQHAHLFYSNRSTLVHEFQQAGIAPDFGRLEVPYYIHHGIANERPRHYQWLLVYPSRFFRKLCMSLLESVRNHLHSTSGDPFEMYSTSQFIIEELG